MKCSEILIEKIKFFEGFCGKAMKCPAGIPTIGYGHTGGVKMGQTITHEGAVALLKKDLVPIENYLNGIKRDWKQGQFDAVADFCFNLGTGAFMKSTLKKKIMAKCPLKDIQAQFKLWDKARVNGVLKALPGLTKRRAWEAERYGE